MRLLGNVMRKSCPSYADDIGYSFTGNVVTRVKAIVCSYISQSEITTNKKAKKKKSQAEIMPNKHLFGNPTSAYELMLNFESTIGLTTWLTAMSPPPLMIFAFFDWLEVRSSI